MQKDQALIQNPGHNRPCFLGFFAVEEGFGELDVPVADPAPDEGIERVRGVVEAEGGEGRVDLFADAGGLADDPAVGGRGRGGGLNSCKI